MNRRFFPSIIRLFVLLTVIITGYTASAQYSISGIVLNDATGKPLGGASVYINGSTIGTVTSDSGTYTLRNINTGFYEVVVSFVGYQTLVYKAAIQNIELKITFKLQRKVEEMRNAVVLSDAVREKWLKTFRDHFLGITEPAKKCKLVNDEEVLFETDDENPKVIKAYSAVPLIIENKQFGYRIHFQLESFYFDPVEGRTFFYGYSRFEELKEKEKIPGRYLRERTAYYKGSTQHFYHSLIAHTSAAEGFSLQLIKQVEMGEQKKSMVISVPGSRRTMPAPSNTMNVAVPIVADSIFQKDTAVGSSLFTLSFEGRLRVKYAKNPAGKKFMMMHAMIEGAMYDGAISYIEMLERPVYMDAQGSLYNPMGLQFSGYWGFEKVGNMLPVDFKLVQEVP